MSISAYQTTSEPPKLKQNTPNAAVSQLNA